MAGTRSQQKMTRQKMIHATEPRESVRLCALVFVSTLFVGAVKADLCPDFSPVPEGTTCLEINHWSDFGAAIDDSATGSELLLCPFDIKTEDAHETAVIERGLTLRCMRKTEEDACIIRGTGTHVRVATSDDTLIQGLSFRESDDYAVHIVSKTEDASKATHTFCHCSLIE
jgi:hypothetical protein